MCEAIGQTVISGAFAGFLVDTTLYPIDTIKTRLQSVQGFKAAGGFRNIYRGIGSVAVGSAPSSALFFLTYSTMKRIVPSDHALLVSGLAALTSECISCIVRVPTELIKQRAQAQNRYETTRIVLKIYRTEGLIGIYRGYASTIAREIPFSVIQFPLWEFLKKRISVIQSEPCSPLLSAVSGSVAGSIAAAITTPLDVAKTRIMLHDHVKHLRIGPTLWNIFETNGIRALYLGVIPRTIWTGVGGFIFFGAYEFGMWI